MKAELSDAAKNFWDVVISTATLVSVVVGGGFAGWQYLDAVKKDKIEHTLEYVTRYQQAPLYDQRQTVDSVWPAVVMQLGDELGRGTATEARSNQLYAAIVLSQFKPTTDRQKALSGLIDFYDQLATCVSEKLCDADTAKHHFGIDAKALLDNAYPFICAQRAFWHDRDFARPAAVFALGQGMDAACLPWTFGKPRS